MAVRRAARVVESGSRTGAAQVDSTPEVGSSRKQHLRKSCSTCRTEGPPALLPTAGAARGEHLLLALEAASLAITQSMRGWRQGPECHRTPAIELQVLADREIVRRGIEFLAHVADRRSRSGPPQLLRLPRQHDFWPELGPARPQSILIVGGLAAPWPPAGPKILRR